MYLYINLACQSVCLFVCLYPINVKTAEPIGSEFCVGPHMTLGKVYGFSKKKFNSPPTKFDFIKMHELFFIKRTFCLILFNNV